MELFDDGHIEALLCDQHLYVATSKGSGSRGVNKRLGEKATSEGERTKGRFVRAFPALHAGETLDPNVGQAGRAKNKTATGSLFEGEPGLSDLGIFFERSRERGVERDSLSSRKSKRARDQSENSEAKSGA
jgi:hypothetical protein